MKFDKEYLASLAIVLVGVLKIFKVEIGTEVITALLIAVLGLYNAVKKYQGGNIGVFGVRKG